MTPGHWWDACLLHDGVLYAIGDFPKDRPGTFAHQLSEEECQRLVSLAAGCEITYDVTETTLAPVRVYL